MVGMEELLRMSRVSRSGMMVLVVEDQVPLSRGWRAEGWPSLREKPRGAVVVCGL
jgi:hypothetical protein